MGNNTVEEKNINCNNYYRTNCLYQWEITQ